MTDGDADVARTAAAVIAGHDARDLARRRRVRRWLGAAMTVALVYAVACHPRYQRVAVAPDRSVDVISVATDAGAGGMFGTAGSALGPALVVSYWSGARDAQGQGLERLDVLEWARPRAEQLGLRAVVLWRTEPVISRWLPFVRGDAVIFRRKLDGTWGGL